MEWKQLGHWFRLSSGIHFGVNDHFLAFPNSAEFWKRPESGDFGYGQTRQLFLTHTLLAEAETSGLSADFQ